MIRGLSGTAIAENESEMEREDDGQLQREVKDLEHGVKQGGKVSVYIKSCRPVGGLSRSVYCSSTRWHTRRSLENTHLYARSLL